jgi:hypothetical protein
MQVTFKTIKQETFKLDIRDDETVSDTRMADVTDCLLLQIGAIKDKLQSERIISSKDATKVIYSGKVLTDELTFADVKYDEKKFIVVMESKVGVRPDYIFKRLFHFSRNQQRRPSIHRLPLQQLHHQVSGFTRAAHTRGQLHRQW